jgi:PAS domain S-box-containing protein
MNSPLRPRPANRTDPSYRGGLLLIAVLGLGLLCMLALWARSSWNTTLADAQTTLQRLATVNALPVALAVRDGRRAAESMDLALTAAPGLDAPELLRVLASELALRFHAGETADLFEPGRTAMLASTAGDSFNPALLGAQLQHLTKARSATLGWAYERGGAWWLPLFYVRTNGQVLVINLPANAMLGQWLAPAWPGENPVGLRSADERVLLRRPYSPAMLGADARGAASTQLMNQQRALGATSGAVRAVATETDHVERLIGWALVPGTDLRMLTAASTDNVFIPWRTGTAPTFVAMAVLIALALGGAAMSLRRLQRLAGRERQALALAQQAQVMTRTALWGSRDITWQMPLAGGDMHFGGDLAALLGAPAAGNDTANNTLDWLLTHVDAGRRQPLHQAIEAARERGDNIHLRLSAMGLDGQPRHLVLNGRQVDDVAGLAPVWAGTLRDVTTQAQAQAQLADSEATLLRMCAMARIGPWQVDTASGTLSFSAMARELYGVPADARLPAWRDFHPADAATRERVQAARDRLLREGVGYDLVLPADLPDGSRRWLRSVAAAHYTDGVLDRVDGAVQDVTAQVLAQTALNEQSTRARLLVEAMSASSQLLLVTDAQQRITWCNNTFVRRTGYTLDEIRGKQPGALLQRGTVPQAINALMSRHVAAREAFTGVRVQNFSKSGEPYWVDLEVRPVFDDQGQLECFIGLQTDVTHDIEREHALRESAHRFELATAHAGMGVYELDIEHRARSWSEGMYRLFGFDPAQGLPSAEAIDTRVLPEDRPLRLPAFMRACDDVEQYDWVGEFRVTRPDGSLVWLQSRCQIERDDSGRAVRAVGTTLDITSARIVAVERQARGDAEARSKAKTAFLSRMSHELRTPLHAMIGYAQLINSAPETLPGVAAAYVERIESAGWHLLALIDDVLELALLDRDDVSVALEAVPLDAVVREALSFVERDASKACLRFDLCLDPVVAWADSTRVRQVAVNLLSNAVKYNLAAGSVRVAVRCDGEQACVEVADTGLGMTGAQLANLYEPFNRLGRENSGVTGTGIGLAITKRLVERMGGTLEVASRIDAGTTFTLRLPLAASTEREVRAPTPARAEPESRTLSVLCIEDNEVNALLLRETLHRLRPDWPLRVAATGYDATQVLREAPVDLVFLDLNLPDTHGLEWLDGARGAGLLHHAEVALLTADVMPQTRAAAEAAGLRYFLSKPFHIADLERLLSDLATFRSGSIGPVGRIEPHRGAAVGPIDHGALDGAGVRQHHGSG